MARPGWVTAALAIAAARLCACATSVAGRAVFRASGQPGDSRSGGQPSISASGLLLQSGDSTPFGAATAIAVVTTTDCGGDNYFADVRPAECSAAVVCILSDPRVRWAVIGRL